MPTTTTVAGKGLATFDATSATTAKWIADRWAYLATKFYANGRGTCNSLGVCTCNENYFGQACEQCMFLFPFPYFFFLFPNSNKGYADCGVSFSQTKTNSWVSGSQTFSQWSVTVNVGSSALYGVVLKAVHNATSFSAWGIDQVLSFPCKKSKAKKKKKILTSV